MRDRIRELADQVWKGLDAQDELHQIFRDYPKDTEHPDNPGPTEITELTDHLYRPEHVSRIAHSEPKPRTKQRRRFVPSA